jgi:hypothetical protein
LSILVNMARGSLDSSPARLQCFPLKPIIILPFDRFIWYE